MEQTFTYIETNWYNLLSLFIGFVGIVLAIVFYFKAKKTKRPVYSISSFNLLTPEIKTIENLKIAYNNNEIESLTASRLVFWNAGKETIDKSHIPIASNLKISTNDKVVIYSAEISYVSEDSNHIQLIKQSTNEILVTFEYLDYNQGAIIKILHSGDSSSDLCISGKVKGVGDFKISNGDYSSDNIFDNKVGMLIVSLVLVASTILADQIFVKSICFVFIIGLMWRYFEHLRQVKMPLDLKEKFNK